MSFLTPVAFLGGLLAIPIILLYMLRLRRREVVVSSTFLWQQVLQDNEANAPWQRLRRNLLLLLQLLILLLLVLALARPFQIVPAVSTGQTTLLLDASASMNATDIDGEMTRFAAAQQSALEIISTMTENDTMTIIAVSDVPDVLVSSSQDPIELRTAVFNAKPSTTVADWNAALTLAAGTATSGENFNVVIVGDGGLGDAAGLPGLQGEIRYVPIGENSGNVAITALATRIQGGGTPQLFAQVTNYGATDAEIIFDLRVDGDLFTAERYTVEANSTLPLVTEALPEDFASIEAGITPATNSDTLDYLTLDNKAWTVNDDSGLTEALVISPGNRFVDRVLGSLPNVRHTLGNPEIGLPQREFDLYVFDRYLPDTLPDGDMLIIAPPQSVPGLFTVGLPVDNTGNPIVLPNDPRTAFLDFDSVNIRTFNAVDTTWAEPLIANDGGVLLWAGENEGRQIAILTFALTDSDLPLQITFPIMISNLLDWYNPGISAINTTAIQVSRSVIIQPQAIADTVVVEKPDGTEREFNLTGERVIYADTDLTGIYKVFVKDGNNTLQVNTFAVNLFDPQESDITPRTTISLGDLIVGEAEREEFGQREYWSWLALGALAILLIEWIIYHNRLRGPRVDNQPPLSQLLRRRTTN